MATTPRFFTQEAPIRFEGRESRNPLAFRWYDRDRMVLGKTMEAQLRFAVAYWHALAWPGGDPFGGETFLRPWMHGSDEMALARRKAEVGFDLFRLLDVPFFCFHDRDVAPEGATLAESNRNLDAITAIFEERMAREKVKLLWGTANLFSNRRFMAGAATNPDPDVFIYAAAQVKHALETTHRLGGANYVLWGGREGYETLLNTDLGQELDQLGRFVSLVEHKSQARARPARAVPVAGRRAQAQDRLHGHHPGRAEAAGADQAPVRLRCRDRLRLPQALRPGKGRQGQHRGQPRDPRWPYLRA